MKKIYVFLVINLVGLSTYAQLDVVVSTSNGIAAKIEIKHGSNPNDVITGITNGTGIGVLGSQTATTTTSPGVKGTSASTSNGTGASGGATGVFGQITSTNPGTFSAGVRGVNNGTSAAGIGVAGYQNGFGWGVYGSTPNGTGVLGTATSTSAINTGVRGETSSPNGIALEAKYIGTGLGTALEVDNGAIRVSGSNRAAFVHTATPDNKLSSNGTVVDNLMCNGDPNCFLFVTQKIILPAVYNNSPIGVYYNAERSKWEIFNENNVPIPNDAKFNVLVIKQ